MRYVSIDIETTGLNPERHQVLSFAAVVEDTVVVKPLSELPRLCLYVTREGEDVVGDAKALAMNRQILEHISGRVANPPYEYVDEGDVGVVFAAFLREHGFPCQRGANGRWGAVGVTVAGSNVSSFDVRFLERLPGFVAAVNIGRKAIDPSVFFLDWAEDVWLPGLGECKKRAGLAGGVVHDALADALDVISLVRKYLGNG